MFIYSPRDRHTLGTMMPKLCKVKHFIEEIRVLAQKLKLAIWV